MAAVLLAAVTLPSIGSVGVSAASAAQTPTPPPAATARTGGLPTDATTTSAAPAAGATPPVAATTPAAASRTSTPPVPAKVPDAPAKVRAKIARYSVSEHTWKPSGKTPKITLRIDARRITAARVQVRIERRSSGRIVTRQSLGVIRSGVDVTKHVTKRIASKPGSYRLRLIVRDATGHRDRRRVHTLRVKRAPAKRTSAVTPPNPAVGGYVFPVQGPCNFKSLAGQRFHARRGGGRLHNGQDIGTFTGFPPVVAVTAATVDRVWYDDEGGGWTIVFNGDDGIAYGYLHLKAGSIVVQAGDRVAAGQRVANAGNTGGDYEPHLHFEMRPQPWAANRDQAIDPLPLLEKLPNPCSG